MRRGHWGTDLRPLCNDHLELLRQMQNGKVARPAHDAPFEIRIGTHRVSPKLQRFACGTLGRLVDAGAVAWDPVVEGYAVVDVEALA